jgi:hypothetical protein
MTMREDVRKAFERQQSGLGDLGDARGRLMQGAMASLDRPQSRGWQWAATVAAILIAAIVVTTFALVKAGTRMNTAPAATPSPRAQASPTPLSNQLLVPNSAPVIFYRDPANFDQLDGVTWDGKISGKVGVGVTMGGSGNPQGTLYQTAAGELRNRSGDLLAPKGFGDVFFADDSVHYCEMVRAGFTDGAAAGVLWLGAFGTGAKRITQVGQFGSVGSNAGGPVVAACSLLADRAVVYQAAGQGVGVKEFWVIQLSTGRTLWHGGSGGWIAASHDGRYIGLADSNDHSAIYGPNGAMLTHVQGTVFAFSWDGDYAVVAAAGGSPSIIYWISGQLTIWNCPPGVAYSYWQAFPEPGGTHVAIGAFNPSYQNTNGFQPVDLFVVDTHGATGGFEKKDVTLFQY